MCRLWLVVELNASRVYRLKKRLGCSPDYAKEIVDSLVFVDALNGLGESGVVAVPKRDESGDIGLFMPLFDGGEKKSGEGGFLSLLSGDSDVTSQMILQGLGKIDKDLPMKTEIRNPVATTIVDLFALRSQQLGFPKTALLLRAFNTWMRVNNVSKGRKGREEMIEGFKAVYVEELRKAGQKDDVFGSKRQ